MASVSWSKALSSRISSRLRSIGRSPVGQVAASYLARYAVRGLVAKQRRPAFSALPPRLTALLRPPGPRAVEAGEEILGPRVLRLFQHRRRRPDLGDDPVAHKGDLVGHLVRE